MVDSHERGIIFFLGDKKGPEPGLEPVTAANQDRWKKNQPEKKSSLEKAGLVSFVTQHNCEEKYLSGKTERIGKKQTIRKIKLRVIQVHRKDTKL